MARKRVYGKVKSIATMYSTPSNRRAEITAVCMIVYKLIPMTYSTESPRIAKQIADFLTEGQRAWLDIEDGDIVGCGVTTGG